MFYHLSLIFVVIMIESMKYSPDLLLNHICNFGYFIVISPKFSNQFSISYVKTPTIIYVILLYKEYEYHLSLFFVENEIFPMKFSPNLLLKHICNFEDLIVNSPKFIDGFSIFYEKTSTIIYVILLYMEYVYHLSLVFVENGIFYMKFSPDLLQYKP